MEGTFEISTWIDHILSSIPYLKAEYVLAGAFVLTLLADLFSSNKVTITIASFGVISSAILGVSEFSHFGSEVSIFGGHVLLSKSVYLVSAIIDLFTVCVLVLAFADKDLEKNAEGRGEFISLIVGATLGAHFMVMASSWLMVLIGLETLGLASYVLVAYRVRRVDPSESSVKYVLFGLFSTALMIYGLSWLYGATGTLNFYDESFIAGLTNAPLPVVITGLAFTLAGFAFKLSAVPFHFWTPDVYEGSSGPVSLWLSIIPKIAAFWMLFNFMDVFYVQNSEGEFFWPVVDWKLVWAIVGAVTLTFGNLAALFQQNFRRLMAYSSIAHTGFVLFLVALMKPDFALFYLIVYGLMNLGLFSIGVFIQNKLGFEFISQFGGLGKKWPVAGLTALICLLGLIGIPPTGGFVAKMMVYSVLWTDFLKGDSLNLIWLIILVINTLISVYYYLRIPYFMFVKDADSRMFHPRISIITRVLGVIAAVGVLIIGLYPQLITNLIF